MRRNWQSPKGHDEYFENDETPKIITHEKIQVDQTPQCNKLYFYTEVTRDSILVLNRQIDELNKQMKMVEFCFGLQDSPRIEIHICSEGGDVYAAMAAVDKIADNPIPIDTYCEGIVASAATLLSSMGHRRYITKSSTMLIHQLRSDFWGNYAQFKDEVKNLDLYMGMIKSVYLKKTKFNNQELIEFLNHDLFLNSQKCLDYGLVDEII